MTEQIRWERFAPDAKEAFRTAAARWPRPRQISSDIDALLQEAEEARPLLLAIGERLAVLAGGRFILAPNKTRDSVKAKVEFFRIMQGEEGGAHNLTDYCRGVLLFDDAEGIRRFRLLLRGILENNAHPEIASAILNIRDRYTVPSKSGFSGIFQLLRLANGHVGEIQAHTVAYWDAIQELHPLYKQVCEFTNRYGGVDHIPAGDIDAYKTLKQRHDDLADSIDAKTGAANLRHTAPGNFDCSWPVRQRYDQESQRTLREVAIPQSLQAHKPDLT